MKEWAKEFFTSLVVEKENIRSKLEEMQLKMESEKFTQQLEEEEADL